MVWPSTVSTTIISIHLTVCRVVEKNVGLVRKYKYCRINVSRMSISSRTELDARRLHVNFYILESDMVPVTMSCIERHGH